MFLFEQSAIIADCIQPKKEFGNPTYIFKNQIMVGLSLPSKTRLQVNKMALEKNAEPLRFGIRSSDPSQNLSFLCQAGSQEERDEWLAHVSLLLDQQRNLLNALVDPKKYQSQLASSVANVSL